MVFYNKFVTDAEELLLQSDYHFDIPLSPYVYKNVSKDFSAFGALVYGSPIFTPRHLDGAMDGTVLTLLEGIKEWTVYTPKGKKFCTITQKPNQTVFLPPGFSHEVLSSCDKSIAYGALYVSSKDQKASAICDNREFVKSMTAEHRQQLTEEICRVIVPSKKGSTKMQRMMTSCGKVNAKKKGGSNRRYKDGRKRNSSKLTFKKKK